MKTNLKTIAVAAALAGAAAPAFAQSQLVANAGLTPAEARGPVADRDRRGQVQPRADGDNQQKVLRAGRDRDQPLGRRRRRRRSWPPTPA